MVIQGFFSSTEISVISSRLLKLHHRKDKGDKAAGKIYSFIVSPENFLATTLVGTNLSMVLSSSFITFVLIHYKVPDSNLWITFLFTPLVVIFSELVPKSIGRYFKDEYARRTIIIFGFFEKLFFPLVYAIGKISKLLVNLLLAGKVRKRSLFVTKEELRALVRETESAGGIDFGEKKAIDGIFDFKAKKIQPIYTRLAQTITINYRQTYEEILALAKEKEFTRFPIVRDNSIIGYINIFDLFYAPQEDWHLFVRPLMTVNAGEKLYDVFIKMRDSRNNIALVLDNTHACGIITLEDLVSEIITSIVKI
jgi:putative hemolysin